MTHNKKKNQSWHRNNKEDRIKEENASKATVNPLKYVQ